MVANVNLGLSLADALLPSEKMIEGSKINQLTAIQQELIMESRHKRYLENLRLIDLFLSILKQTVNAVKNQEYRKFDALVKNFGCQITALEVYRLLQTPGLQETANELEKLVQEKLKGVKSLRNCGGQIRIRGLEYGTYSIRDLINKLDLDARVDEVFARLVRLRLLTIVNTNVLKEGREVPRTDPSKLAKIVNIANHSLFKNLVEGLQAEESVIAADFIQKVSQELPEDEARNRLIVKALREKYRRQSEEHGQRNITPIVSLPLLYNTEASIKGMNAGVIAVKSKTDNLGKTIAGAKDVRYFVDAAAQRLLNQDEVKALPHSTPLIVVEGYIKDPDLLARNLEAGKLIEIINANCALLPQYASGTDQSPLIDRELEEDITAIKRDAESMVQVFDVDHIYCASVKEIRLKEAEDASTTG